MSWSASGRSVRSSVLLVLALALIAGVLSAVGRPTPALAAPADTAPSIVSTNQCPPKSQAPDCVEPRDLFLVNDRDAAPSYAMSDSQFAGLRELERIAVDTLIARHGLEATDDERARIRIWNRTELRSELVAQILAAASKPPASRSAAEQSSLLWFADVQQRRNVAIAQAAFDEFVKFAGPDYRPGAKPANLCSYVPPAPFESEYPGEGKRRWRGCDPNYGGNLGGLFDLGGPIPTPEEFTRWGQGIVTQGEFTPSANVLTASMQTWSGTWIAALAGGAVAAAGAGALSGMSAAALTSLSTMLAYQVPQYSAAFLTNNAVALSKIAEKTFEGVVNGVLNVNKLPVPGLFPPAFSAASIFAAAGVMITAITLCVQAILQVVNGGQVGDKLREQLDKARVTPVDPVAALTDPSGGGTGQLMLAVQAVTTTGAVLDVASDRLRPAAGGDTALRVVTGATRSVDTGVTTYDDDAEGNSLVERRVTYSHGWWTTTGDGVPDGQVVAQDFTAHLNDPDKPVVNGVATSRPVFSFPVKVSTLMQGEQRLFLVRSLAPGVAPKPGSGCRDLQNDFCWITETLPLFNDRNRTTTISFVPNHLDVPTVEAPDTVNQGVPFTLAATRDGAPFVTDSEGDPVTVTWRTVGCGDFYGCPQPGTGATATFTIKVPGDYTFQMTAADSLGAVQTATRTVRVLNVAPSLTVDQASLTGTGAGPVTLTGTAVDKDIFERVSVNVDWGDGTPVVRQQVLFDAWSLGHTYGTPGTYTATVTSDDGRSTSAPQRIPVTIGNDVPVVTLLPDSKTPSTWRNLPPGTTLTLNGTVADADILQAVDLEVTWYDGATETIPVKKRNYYDKVRSFTLTHRSTAASYRSLDTVGFDPALVTVTAVDADGARSQPKVVTGSVQDAPGTFAYLNSTTGGGGSQSATVHGRVSDPNGPTNVWVDWAETPLPDGEYGEPVTVDDDGTFDVSHSFATPGMHTVTVTTGTPGLLGVRISQQVNVFVLDETRILKYARWVNPPVVGQKATLELAVDSPADGTVVINWGPVPLGEKTEIIDFPAGEHVLRYDHVYQRPFGPGIVDGYTLFGDDGVGGDFSFPDAVVANPAPTAPVLEPLTAEPGAPVTVPLTYSDLGADVNTVGVDWGDGSPVQQSTLSQDEPTQDLTHTYADTGVYRPTFTVTDQVGNTVQASTRAVIGTPLPVLGAPALTVAREGAATVIRATAVDPVGGATRLRVDWGDGTVATSDPATTVEPFELSHVYADNGKYPVKVQALDEADDASAVRQVRAEVPNAAPTVAVTVPPSVDEGAPVDVAFTVTDPGSKDTGTAIVDWGDGTSTSGLTWTADQRTVTARHGYADDAPSATASDRKRVTVQVRDNAGGTKSGGASLTVRNVAPTLSSVAVTDVTGRTLGRATALPVNSPVTVTVQATDPGVDTLTATVVWGDGATSTVPVDASGYVSATHTYTAVGVRPVAVTVADDDLGRTTAPTVTARIQPGEGMLRSLAVAAREAAKTEPALRASLLRGAARLIAGSPTQTGPTVLSATAAGDRVTAIDLLGQAFAKLDAAASAGANPAITDRRVDLVTVMRSTLVAYIATAVTDDNVRADGQRSLGRVDAVLGAGDLSGAVVLLRQALVTVTPDPAP